MRRRRWAWVAGVAAGLLGGALLAETGVVRTKGGQTLQGDVRERGDVVSITIHGVETLIPRSDVASIDYVTSYEQDFKARLAKLDPKDEQGRIALAREAFDRGQYELAMAAADSAQQVNPNSQEAARLIESIQAQRRLERNRVAEPAPATAAPRPAAPPAQVDRRLLTPADIEQIRRKELKPTDTGARIRFDPNVKNQFARSQNMEYKAFDALTPIEQATQIIEEGTPEMRQKVHVLNDPSAILEYRRTIQPMILNNCATANCHGGPAGGKLILFNPADNDAVTYTNFFILAKFSKQAGNAGGVFGKGEKKLIERGQGEDSLLANYGLPTDVAEMDHPPVNGRAIQPLFRSRDDAKYRALVNWMNVALKPVEPEYTINYTPPGEQAAAAASQPASQPAEGAAEPGQAAAPASQPAAPR